MKYFTDQFQLCFCFCIGNTKQPYCRLYFCISNTIVILTANHSL